MLETVTVAHFKEKHQRKMELVNPPSEFSLASGVSGGLSNVKLWKKTPNN